MAPVTLQNVWMSIQRLPSEDRKQLANMLSEMSCETEAERKVRVADSIDRFFGGWSDDPRSIDEIKTDIKSARTTNTFFA